MLKENGISKKLIIVLSIAIASLFVACSNSSSSMDDAMMKKDKMHDTMMEKKDDGMMKKDSMHKDMIDKKDSMKNSM
ncbi:MAG: hypothetical protein HRT42_04030 [Campylobacteraceae bacterium]|nr:hypothetical protein [Campylobacteraceae bacterium]